MNRLLEMYLVNIILIIFAVRLAPISNALCVNRTCCENPPSCNNFLDIKDSCTLNDFKYAVTDSVQGILEVNFTSPLLSRCDVNNFTLILFSYPGVSPKECRNVDIKNIKKENHSYQIWCNYNAGACAMDPHPFCRPLLRICGEDMHVRFSEVPNGCYSLDLKTQENVHLCDSVSYSPFVISYDKDRTQEHCNNIYAGHVFKTVANNNAVETTFTSLLNDDWIEAEEIRITFLYTSTNQEIFIQYKNICNRTFQETTIKEYWNLTCLIDRTAEVVVTMNCVLQNASEGTYEITIDASPISEYSRPALRCVYNHTYEINHISFERQLTKIIIPFAVVPILCLLGIILYYFGLRYKLKKIRIKHLSTRIVILIYARDCEPMMKLIEAFTNLLNKSDIKVLDIFDPKCIDQYGANKFDWLQEMLRREAVPVFCSTEVGKVLYERSSNARDDEECAFRVAYRSPDCFDDQFVRSIKEIMRMPKIDYYVVGFNGLTKENQLKQLRPKQYLLIPRDMSLFLKIFGIDINNTDIPFEKRKLELSLNNVKSYIAEKPNYILSDLLR